MLEENTEYFELLDEIKNSVVKTRNNIYEDANRHLIMMYYNIGCKLIKNNKWGSSFIDTLAKDIKISFPTIKGMSARNLRYMQKFAKEYDNDEFLQEVLAKLSWNHNQMLMDKIKDVFVRRWYAKKTIENGWSTTVLAHEIGLKLYERQGIVNNKITNFDSTLPSPNNENVKELLKDPYIFDFISANEDLKELEIEDALISNITKLLLELGNGFAFIGWQYHLEIGNKDYYIDLLFYNLKVKSYVVIELKTTEFKPEYSGQLNFYLSAIDKYVKGEDDNPSFGILLCREKDRITAELSLKDINKPIGVSEYKILSDIPEYLKEALPSIEDIEQRLDYMID